MKTPTLEEGWRASPAHEIRLYPTRHQSAISRSQGNYYYYQYFYHYYYHYYYYIYLNWQILYRFLPIKRVTTDDQWFMGLLPISYVFKNLYLSIFLHSFSPIQSLEPYFSPSPFPILFWLSHQRFHKPYPKSKTFLNIRVVLVVLFSAVMMG